MGAELAAMIDRVRQMCGASSVLPGTIELAILLLGYRKVAEPLMTLPPVQAVPPFAEPIPPTAGVDEIMSHLAPPRK